MMKSSFFDQVQEKPEQARDAAIGLFVLFVVLLWVYTANLGQEKNAMVYIIMLILAGFTIGFNIVFIKQKDKNFLPINGVGKDWQTPFIYGIILSIVLIIILVKQSIIEPLSITSGKSILGFLFVVIAAPIVETSFFRGTMQPLFVLLVNNHITNNKAIAWSIAAIIQSVIFAFFHVNILVSNTVGLGGYLPYFIFGIIATIGVYYFKNITFEFGLHGFNNFFAWWFG